MPDALCSWLESLTWILVKSQHTLELRILWSSINMESRCDRSAGCDLLATAQGRQVFFKGGQRT